MKEKVTRIFGYSEVIAILLCLLFFVIFSNISAGFFSTSMFHVILLTGAELGIIAIGEALLIISGEIDLSVGSIFVFGNFVTLKLTNMGLPFPVSVIIALSFGCFAGFLNGFITLKFKIPSFIVTLGSLLFWRAALAGVTYGEPTYYEGKPSFLLNLLGGKIAFIPKLFFWFLGLGVIFSLLLSYTKFGNWVLATGGNKETARALGVNTNKIKLMCFMIASALAAFAGTAYLARSSYLDPIVATGVELEAIASAVIGGVLLTGGIGSIPSTVICAFLLKEIQVGIGTYGIRVEYYKVVVGALLVMAAIVNKQIRQRIMNI